MTDSPFTALYLRLSRDKAELADPDLLHKHRRELLRLAAAQGQQVRPEHIFEEQGSGQTLRGRPAARALLTAIQALPRGAGGFLWTTEVSRLTRGSLSDRARIYEALSRARIIHCTRAAQYDLHNVHQLHYWEDQAENASYELAVYKDRVAAARLDMALEGRIPTGKPPFGWWWDRNVKNADGSKGAVRPKPREFPLVQAICRDALHLSSARLAVKYGIPDWKILYLLRNPFLCGQPCKRHAPHEGDRLRLDTGEPWLNSSHRLGREQWIRPEKPGDYEPACTVAEWEAIQEALDQRRETKHQTGAANAWCRDLVRFVGHDRWARLNSRKSWGETVPIYELSPPGGKRQTAIYIPRAVVHEAVSAALIELLASQERIEAGFREHQAAALAAPGPADTSALITERERLERLLDALLERELETEGDPLEIASIRRKREEVKAALKKLQAQLTALRAHAALDPAIDEFQKGWEAIRQVLAGQEHAMWHSKTFSDADRQKIASGLIDTVPCRVEPSARPDRWIREVQDVRWKTPWRMQGK